MNINLGLTFHRELETTFMPDLSKARILVIEDDPKISKALDEGLSAEGYKVFRAATGEEGFFFFHSENISLVLLDWMLPGRDGIEILRTLRKANSTCPVLLLTARDGVEDRVVGLDAGADDYLVKPFAFPELLARVRALIRRGQQSETVAKFQIADLEMDLIARKVKRNEQLIELTLREFELLEYLFKNQNQVVSREMLARDVWKETARATSLDNVIDVHIARLRKKIDQEGLAKLIHTIRGLGFQLNEEKE
jgi:two-component system copper resistance phosphate regulon response regulator CusR